MRTIIAEAQETVQGVRPAGETDGTEIQAGDRPQGPKLPIDGAGTRVQGSPRCVRCGTATYEHAVAHAPWCPQCGLVPENAPRGIAATGVKGGLFRASAPPPAVIENDDAE